MPKLLHNVLGLHGNVQRCDRINLYKACVAIALRMGLKSTDLKLITAVLFLVILVVSMERKGRKNA